jgi:hypothetical protein
VSQLEERFVVEHEAVGGREIQYSTVRKRKGKGKRAINKEHVTAGAPTCVAPKGSLQRLCLVTKLVTFSFSSSTAKADLTDSTMSLLTRKGHVTVRAFAVVPTLADLQFPEIQQEPGSVSNVSSFRGADGHVDLAEGCVLTKWVKHTHQVVHWVNAVCSGDTIEVVSRKLIGVYSPQLLNTFQEYVIESVLGIIPYEDFSLDDPCNLAYCKSEGYAWSRWYPVWCLTVEAFVHTSLDLYTFIALTASSSTLCDLIEMVKVDNNWRQQEMDETGVTGRAVPRMLNVTIMTFSSALVNASH